MEKEQVDGNPLPSPVRTKSNSFDTMPSKSLKCKNFGICTKSECIKSIEERLPEVKPESLITWEEKEEWEVKCLPTNFEPVSKPSKVIDKLYKKRKERHDAIMTGMKKEREEVNADIEAQMRLKSDEFKREVAGLNENVEATLEKFQCYSSDQLLKLSKKNLEDLLKELEILHKTVLDKIDAFHEQLQEFEKMRSEKYKIILRKAYNALRDISYKLPYELHQHFSDETLKINQIILSNLRCYADLRLQLNLQAENCHRIDFQSYEAIIRKWRSATKKELFNRLFEKSLKEPEMEAEIVISEKAKQYSGILRDKELNVQKICTRLPMLTFTTKDVSKWSKDMQHTVNGLDICARQMIDLYRECLLKVFSGYFDELQTLTETMLETGLIDPGDVSLLNMEFSKPAFETVTKEYSEQVVGVENLWDRVITNLQLKLQDAYVFINEVAHLWESHYQRQAQLKEIVFKDLNAVIRKNNSATEEQECRCGIVLDQMRQAPNIKALEASLRDVNSNLDGFKKTYTAHYNTEVKVLDKYKALSNIEIDTLMTELKAFLSRYSSIKDISPTIFHKRASQLTANEQPVILSIRLKQSELQVSAVENWMFGLYEAIQHYASGCKAEVANEVENWVKEQSTKLAKRLEVKMGFHASRYGRVKSNVYEIRLAELKTHSDRVERHKAGADKEISDIKTYFLKFEQLLLDAVGKHHKKMNAIKFRLKKARNSSMVKSCVLDVKHSTNACSEELQKLAGQLEAECNKRLYKIRKTALDFSQEIKIFAEGGNFHYDEAKAITKDLKGYEKTIKKKLAAARKEVSTRGRKLLQQVQFKEAETNNSVEVIMEQYTFYDNACDTIKNLQTSIRKEVADSKSISLKIDNLRKNLENHLIDNLGDMACLGFYDENLQEISNMISEITAGLLQPKFTMKLTAEVPDLETFDFAALLFDSEPVQDNSIMSKICFSMYSSMVFLQSVAEGFYSKKREIDPDSGIQPTYIKFLKEVASKYKYYYIQCEIFWLSQVNEFLQLLKNIRKFSQKYKGDFAQKYYEQQRDEFTERHEDVIHEIMEIKKSNMKQVLYINDKLKPLHSYQKNSELLKDIQQEMEETMNIINAFDINDVLQPHKEFLEQFRKSFMDECTEICKKFPTICETCFNFLPNNVLIEHFETILTSLDEFLSQQRGATVPENESSIDQFYREKLRDVFIPKECYKTLEEIKELKKEEFTREETTYYQYIGKFNQEYIKAIAEVTTIEENWDVEIHKLQEIFDKNILTVLELYNVKYDNPT